MKIYKAWSNSNHKIVYTLGYFESKADAESAAEVSFGGSASSPSTGVDEITVIPSSQTTTKPDGNLGDVPHSKGKLSSDEVPTGYGFTPRSELLSEEPKECGHVFRAVGERCPKCGEWD